MEDLITVIVPVYNGEKYLIETIEEIRNQTHKNLEIFLIDDGSKDNSLSICKYFERIDSRIKVFTQKNKGISMTMKRGVLMSNANYIARCDQDDINYPSRYERQLKYLKENNYDMVGCYYKSFGNGSDKIKWSVDNSVNRPIRNELDQYARYCDGVSIFGGSIFARVDVLKKYDPFNEEYVAMEDAYLYIILHKNKCRLGVVEEVLYNYRVHFTNTSLNERYRSVSTPQYFDTLFGIYYEDKILKYKNVVVIKREEELELIRESFKKYFGDKEVRFVNEFEREKFLLEEIFNYDPKDSVFYVGGLIYNDIGKILKSRGFKNYENLFMVVDFFWKKSHLM